MWPMLLELLPHFTRLVPVADKYFSSRSASDKAHQAALAALSEDLRGELGKVTEAQAGIDQGLREQAAQVAELSVDVARTRMGVESVEARMAKLEKAVTTTARLVSVAVVLLAMTLALLGVVFVRVIH